LLKGEQKHRVLLHENVSRFCYRHTCALF